jgi:hypothetical protein
VALLPLPMGNLIMTYLTTAYAIGSELRFHVLEDRKSLNLNFLRLGVQIAAYLVVSKHFANGLYMGLHTSPRLNTCRAAPLV